MQLKNPKKFAEQFLEYFMANGFATLPKREVEILVMHLLLQDGIFGDNPEYIDHHMLSLQLKLPESRIRSLMYEVELKYGHQLEPIEGIIGLIEKGRYEIAGTKVKFSVHSPLLKQYLEYEIRQLDGVSDGSFSKHILTLDLNTFQHLLVHLYGDRSLPETLISEMPPECRQLDKEGIVKVAFEDFIKAFAGRSGTRSADLVFDTIDPLGFLKRVFDQ
jgi:hypothetical protein